MTYDYLVEIRPIIKKDRLKRKTKSFDQNASKIFLYKFLSANLMQAGNSIN